MTPSLSRPSINQLRLDRNALDSFLYDAFPATSRASFGELIVVEPGRAQMRLIPTADMIRPGGIVSGPTLMGLTDVAAYAVVLAHIGPVPMAVTSALNINFLRACKVAPIVADARLLKLGRRQAVIEIELRQDDARSLVAKATVTYALP